MTKLSEPRRASAELCRALGIERPASLPCPTGEPHRVFTFDNGMIVPHLGTSGDTCSASDKPYFFINWDLAGRILEAMRAKQWSCRLEGSGCADQAGAVFVSSWFPIGKIICLSSWSDSGGHLQIASTIPEAIHDAACEALGIEVRDVA